MSFSIFRKRGVINPREWNTVKAHVGTARLGEAYLDPLVVLYMFSLLLRASASLLTQSGGFSIAEMAESAAFKAAHLLLHLAETGLYSHTC